MPHSPASDNPPPATGTHSWQRWNRWVLSIVIVVALGVVGMNVFIDPYQVFRLVPYRNGFTPNELDNKYMWLNKHPEQTEFLLLGSSRTGIWDPRWFDHNGQRISYNFSKLAARPTDIAQLLPALKATGLTPRHIILGIDIFPFLEHPGDRGPAHYPPPFISGESRFTFLARYFFLASFVPSALRLKHAMAEQPELLFDFSTGLYRTPGLIRRRAKDPAAYDAKEYAPIKARIAERALSSRELHALDEIAQWCHDNHVDTRVFIHPHHPVIQAQVGQHNLATLAAEVQKRFPDAWDFTHATDTCGAEAYLDKKHYTPAIARQLQKIIIQKYRNVHFSSFSPAYFCS